MNYYAQGGQAHGLKALAQELPKYGRGGDSIVAHINPEEAMMLKAMGGSGTINPTTGLPEFGMFGIGGGGGFLGTGINKGASDPVSNALSNNPISKGVSNLVQSGAGAIDKGLVSLDKTVGNVIPGGWGTVAQVAGSVMGLPTPMMVGMGALTGSGVLRPGRGFNLQGALMGGAMAYGASELGEYARGAADGAVNAVEKVTEEGLKEGLQAGANAVPTDAIGALNASQGWTGPTATNLGSEISQGAINAANATSQAATNAVSNINPATGLDFSATGSGLAGNSIKPSIGSQIMSGEFGGAATQFGQNAQQKLLDISNPDTYKQFAADRVKDTGDTFSGIKNLVGAGDMTAKQAGQLAAASAKTAGTMSPMMATGMTAYGAMGLQALDEQRQYLQDQANSGAISNAEYNEALAKIEAQAEQGRQIVAANPLRVNLGNEGISEGPSLYTRENSNETLYDKNPYGGTTLYAMGGSVDDEYGMDEARGIMQGNLQKGLFGQGYATGGTPRFLSGGGDGMSDDIPATINGDQTARLADGEFVIPADVVSHIGNGSSKAGAKQLYSMMNKVRKARTGNPKQGKQINPSKYLPA